MLPKAEVSPVQDDIVGKGANPKSSPERTVTLEHAQHFL